MPLTMTSEPSPNPNAMRQMSAVIDIDKWLILKDVHVHHDGFRYVDVAKSSCATR